MFYKMLYRAEVRHRGHSIPHKTCLNRSREQGYGGDVVVFGEILALIASDDEEHDPLSYMFSLHVLPGNAC